MKILYYIALGLLLFGITCDVKGESMEIHNPLPPSIIQNTNGDLIKIHKVAIGPWNCVANESKQIEHGIGANYTNCVVLQVVVFRDDGVTMMFPLIWGQIGDTTENHLVVESFGNTYIKLFRGDASILNNNVFDDPVINRGYVWFLEVLS